MCADIDNSTKRPSPPFLPIFHLSKAASLKESFRLATQLYLTLTSNGDKPNPVRQTHLSEQHQKTVSSFTFPLRNVMLAM